MTTPRELASFGALVAAAVVLDAADYARLHGRPLVARLMRRKSDRTPHAYREYETACEPWCAGASHS